MKTCMNKMEAAGDTAGAHRNEDRGCGRWGSEPASLAPAGPPDLTGKQGACGAAGIQAWPG